MRFAVVIALLFLVGCSPKPLPVPEPVEPQIDLTAAVKLMDFNPEPNGAPKLLNGTVVPVGQKSYAAWSGGCTATLISAKHLITAAHCNPGIGQSWTFKYLKDGKTVSATYRAVKVHIPKAYKPSAFSLGNDVAIIELAAPVAGIKPAKVSFTPVKVGTGLNLSGYGLAGTGLTGPTGGAGTFRIGNQTAEYILAPHILWMFTNTQPIESNLAAGDSGGPVFLKGTDTVVGINSGVSIGSGGKAGVYGTYGFATRLDVHEAWVRGIVPDLL